MATRTVTGFLLVALAATAAVALPGAARASLGGGESTAADDAAHLKASIKSTDAGNYRIHEIVLASGTVVREFANPAGTVFAVTWSGPAIPDLKQTLGSYFDTFTAAARAPHGGHHHLEIRQDQFVMQSSGHMRAFTGRAYLPQEIPAGVTVEELH
jgi:hypothetical protein